MLVRLRVLPETPNTTERWHAYLNASVVDVFCPNNFTFYGCDENGRISWIDITVPPQPPGIVALWQSTFKPHSVVIRNLTGYLHAVVDCVTFEVRDSLITNPTHTMHLLTSAFEITLINVTLPFYKPADLIIPEHWAAVACRFVDVLFVCPLPAWLERCFDAGAARPLPCRQPLPPDASYGVSTFPCLSLCQLQCSSPGLPGFGCEALIESTAKGYFPITPGYATIDMTYGWLASAQELSLKASTAGLVVRIELWDLRNQSWTVAFDDPSPTRSTYATPTISTVSLPPILTNRVRVTLELWFELTDVLLALSLVRVAWPRPVKPMPVPLKQCGGVVSLGERAMLDETLADSLCVRRVCLPLCTRVANYTFERKIRAQWLVVDGGLPLDNRTFAEPSAGTRVYALDNSSIDSLPLLPKLDAQRVRLVGDPLVGEPTQSPTKAPPRGVPGVLVKTRLTSVGASLMRVAQQQPAATTTAAPAPTILLVNGNEPQPPSQRVEFGGNGFGSHRMLAVVYADVRVHNGSRNQLLVNRRVVQTPIDILYVDRSLWFENLVQHDVALNITDIDLFANGSHFAVVGRESGAGSLFHWKPFAYELVECSANDCMQCATNQANIEPCKWCDNECRPRAVMCANQSSSCETETTTETTETTETIETTETTMTTMEKSRQTEMTATLGQMTDGDNLDRSQIIGLAIGIPITIVLLIGVIVAAFVFWKRSRRDEENNIAAKELQQSPTISGSVYDDVDSVRS